MSLFFISPALVLDIIMCNTIVTVGSATGLSFPLGIFMGCGTWENLSIYSADPPEPDIDCITPQHCPKAHATYFIVPLVSLFIYLL